VLPFTWLAPGAKVIPVSRNTRFPLIVTLRIVLFLDTSSLTMVASFTVGFGPPAPVTVVAPCSVIAFVIPGLEVQLNVPAGSVIVSPSCAAFCKACRLAAEPSEE